SFTSPSPTHLYTLSLHDALPISSPVGYVRLHGRRYDTWFTDDATIPVHERYNYLYTAEELAPWVTRVRKVTQRAGETFVVTNNRSEEHTSELQSLRHLVCRLLLE